MASKYTSDEIRERYNELLNKAKNDICAKLNDEFDELIYIQNCEFYINCSDYSPRDVKIS